MREAIKNSSQSNGVLLWEFIYEKELQKVEIILEKKYEYLSKRQSVPYEQLDKKQVRHTQSLQTEIDAFVGCFSVMESLRNAYVSSTAQNSDLLMSLSCQNWALKRENLELQEKLKNIDETNDVLLKIALKPGKEVQNVK